MIKAIIFDGYGTLLDTKKCSQTVMKSILRKCGCKVKPSTIYLEWRKEIESSIKKMNSQKKFKSEKQFFKKALEKTIKKLGIDPQEKYKMKLYQEICWGHRFHYTYTHKALIKLQKKFKVYVASNTDTKPLMQDFTNHSIKVDKVMTSQKFKWYKPHLEFYKEMIKSIPEKSSEVIYVGDSYMNDAIMPKRLGIKTVWLNRKNKKRPGKEKPNYTIKNLNELLKLPL